MQIIINSHQIIIKLFDSHQIIIKLFGACSTGKPRAGPGARGRTGHPLALSAAPASRPQRRRTCTGARPRARLAGGSLRGCGPCVRGGGRHARAAAARGPGEAGGPTRMQPMLRGGLASGRRVGRTAGPLPPSHFLPRPPSPSHPLAPPPAALPRGQPSLSRWSWVPGWAGQQ
jgi:hypothetical protein